MTNETAHGRVTITWPQPNGIALMAWGITAHDADTGEQLLDVTAMNFTHGAPSNWDSGPLYITLTRLVDNDGQPIGDTGSVWHLTDEYLAWKRGDQAEPFAGQQTRTADFRYLIAEMRTAP